MKNVISNLATNTSNEAFTHTFLTKQDSIIVGNNQPVGCPNITTASNGSTQNNVQSAIDDVAALAIDANNSVHICTDGISPAGVSQVDEFKFSGTVAYFGKSTNDEVNFNFYGFPVTVLVGDTGEEVAAKVKRQLEIAQSKGYIIDKVNFGQTLDILQVQYLDCQSHFLNQIYQYSIKIIPTTISAAKPGYGTWSRLGTQTITLDGASEAVTFYYFKRIS